MTKSADSLRLPARPTGRGWFAAVMLLVLLAAAGLPCNSGEVAGRQRVEAVHDASPRAELPRALPRTKSVAARGLPPSRAPTV